MSKRNTAKLVRARDGRLLGVQVPYSANFAKAAKAAGYIWTGKRFGDYWHYDERNLLDGSLTTDQLHVALAEKRAALVPLVEQYFKIEDENMSERVTYTVRYGYLVENQREDWKRLEALLSEKLSDLSQRFVAVRVELVKDQLQWDVTYDRGDTLVDDSHSEEAWDWAWDQMAEEA